MTAATVVDLQARRPQKLVCVHCLIADIDRAADALDGQLLVDGPTQAALLSHIAAELHRATTKPESKR